ncbi:DUF1000-domain-containing protein [Macrolepiota fuliginosa MF-IS2]|uniref:DUF1000-domain-containing protein n=1 Tax=Macrolepiota fuliginosa MF-IS2 TaxID=1400762 RepID=A0A9P5X035_9AGAR|nr:DUF1000-domain-containing protein [Macrolepiota fuliginosa MF-IS2]
MSSTENSEANDTLAASLAGGDASNLFSVIDRDNVHGLNLAVPEHAKELIKPWSERESTEMYADSGVDDQIIIHVPFTENVRLRSIVLKLGRGELAPRHLRIFANHSTIIDFADAETTKSQLDISLLEGEAGIVEYPLRVAAFASVHSLSLFFNEAVGEDVTRVYYIGFKGDVRSSKQAINSMLDVPAPNTGDARLVDRLREGAAGQQTTAR